MAAGLRSPDGEGGTEIKGADALVVRGLMQALPPVGARWPMQLRREWVDAMLAVFAVLYEPEEGPS